MNLHVEVRYEDGTTRIVTFPNRLVGRDSNGKRPIKFYVDGLINSTDRWEWLQKDIYMYMKPMQGEEYDQ